MAIMRVTAALALTAAYNVGMVCLQKASYVSLTATAYTSDARWCQMCCSVLSGTLGNLQFVIFACEHLC